MREPRYMPHDTFQVAGAAAHVPKVPSHRGNGPEHSQTFTAACQLNMAHYVMQRITNSTQSFAKDCPKALQGFDKLLARSLRGYHASGRHFAKEMPSAAQVSRTGLSFQMIGSIDSSSLIFCTTSAIPMVSA